MMRTRISAFACIALVGICLCLGFAAASAEPVADVAKDLTKRVGIVLSEGKKQALIDGKLSSYWTNKKAGATLRIEFPEGEVPGGLSINWAKKTSGFVIAAYARDGEQIEEGVVEPGFTGLMGYYAVAPEVCAVQMRFAKKGNAISELRIYGAGELPQKVQQWHPPVEKADLLLVSAHQDDEFLYMGGAIPHYAVVEGRPVQVIYMANCGRARYQEALNGLWVAGLRNYPEFLGYPDRYCTTLKDAKKYWNEAKVLKALVERIRRYKPEVILSHDLNGEYGHGAHKLTASVLRTAVKQAADPTKFAESASQYGAWQTKKLYLHLYKENRIRMDWKVASDALGGKTPSQVAKLGYAQHKSQLNAFTYVDGGKYDNALFGLAFTAVGEDVVGGDMFENIGEPAAMQPEPVQMPAPVVERTATPSPQMPVQSPPENGGRGMVILLAVSLFSLAVLGFFGARGHLRTKKKTRSCATRREAFKRGGSR